EKLPESHAAMSYVKFESGDWQGAEKEVRQALEIDAEYALAHYIYGFYLALLGRVDESHYHYERAQQLNPTSREAATDGVYAFIAARQYDQAMAHLRKALLLDPN